MIKKHLDEIPDSIMESYMQKVLAETPDALGVHYSDLFEQYLPIKDKPRRLLQDWLPEFFFKTPEGTWRPPDNEEERQQKFLGKEAGPMKFYADGLQPEQIRALRLIAPLAAERHFYLGGGTALAIYLRHRRSVDLYWFTGDPFPDPMSFAQTLRERQIPFETSQTAPGTLHGQVLGVRTSFLEFHYPLLVPIQVWPETEVPLVSLEDLSCMKLSAITQRGSKKDFYDVYALCTEFQPLDQLLELYIRKFKVTDISSVLYALVYYDDAESDPEPVLLKAASWNHVKAAFRKWVKAIT
jgi:hypothetical protein